MFVFVVYVYVPCVRARVCVSYVGTECSRVRVIKGIGPSLRPLRRARQSRAATTFKDVNDVQMCNLVSQEESVYGAVYDDEKNEK